MPDRAPPLQHGGLRLYSDSSRQYAYIFLFFKIFSVRIGDSTKLPGENAQLKSLLSEWQELALTNRSSVPSPSSCENLQCWKTPMHFNSHYSTEFEHPLKEGVFSMALTRLLHALLLKIMQWHYGNCSFKSLDQHQITLGMLANPLSGHRPHPSVSLVGYLIRCCHHSL